MASVDELPFGDVSDAAEHGACERCAAGVLFVELDRGLPAEPLLRAAGEIAGAHGGYVERRGLSGAMCVFCTPPASEPAADAALAAARELRDCLMTELSQADFGIGVSAGDAAGGWIRDIRRCERLVVRAPLSEARRLCALAGRSDAHVLASERAVERASRDEARRWASAQSGYRPSA